MVDGYGAAAPEVLPGPAGMVMLAGVGERPVGAAGRRAERQGEAHRAEVGRAVLELQGRRDGAAAGAGRHEAEGARDGAAVGRDDAVALRAARRLHAAGRQQGGHQVGGRAAAGVGERRS